MLSVQLLHTPSQWSVIIRPQLNNKLSCKVPSVQFKMNFNRRCPLTFPTAVVPLLVLLIIGDGHHHVACGVNDSVKFGGRILLGEVADYVPHAARVTGFSMAYSTEGSGTFVTLRHVLTAASIIHNMSINYVYHGNTSMAYAKALGGVGITHPNYNPATFEHDIGIVTLGSPPTASEWVDASD